MDNKQIAKELIKETDDKLQHELPAPKGALENLVATSKFSNFNGPKKFTKKSDVPEGFEDKVVSIKRISKTTKGGRRMRFSVLVLIGNKNGSAGFGFGKSVEIPVAIKKALKNAKKNITNYKIYKNRTVFHEIVGKKCASRVLIKPAAVGTGIIAGGVIRTILELIGYKDIYSKNLGANSSLNMIQAVIDALLQQKTPLEVTRSRGIQLSDL
jgi:small subunit ribosomal protein S5